MHIIGLSAGRHGLRTLLLASGASLGIALMGAPAYAQEAAPVDGAAPAQEPAQEPVQAQQREIVVTGSRIARRDYEANSPIVTVSENLLQNTPTSSLERNLNQLPQFTPTTDTPNYGGNIQPTATITPGAATISLRGIGTNRNLVLVNGRRAVPGNGSMVVDINTIPSAAIDRVEIISGGASSTYGADAVAGVTNFILKQNFEGLQLDGRLSMAEGGDMTEWTVSGIVGTDFADNRGNVSLAFSTNSRQAAFQRNRKWYRDLWANPNVGGSGFFPPYPGMVMGSSNLPSIDALNAAAGVGPGTPYPGYPGAAGVTMFMQEDGSFFSGFNAASQAGIPAFNGLDNFGVKKTALGSLARNWLDAFLVFPLERYNMYARGNYEVNDWVSVFAEGLFNKVSTRTVQEPSPISGGWSVNIPNDGRDLGPQGAALQGIIDSRNGGVGAGCGTTMTGTGNCAPWTLTWLFPMNRESLTDVFTYNMTAGADFKIPGTDWKIEVFGSQGESETSVLQRGFVSLERTRAVMQSANWGAGFSATGNSDPLQGGGGFGATTATCTSGINPFRPASEISQDCLDAISVNLKTRSLMQQSVWEADATGTLFNLPAGPLQAALGASYRRNRYSYIPDTLMTSGGSFQDQVLGLYPSGITKGMIAATEFYGELSVPVLKDLPLIKSFTLELGARTSHYNTTGNSFTWKALGDWQMTDWLRFRGGFNRAERAPNIAELFLNMQQSFGSAVGGDVCSMANPQAWSANPSRNPNWRKTVEICGALMEASGDPDADKDYYGLANPNNTMNTTSPVEGINFANGADWRTITALTDAQARTAVADGARDRATGQFGPNGLITNAQGSGSSFIFPTAMGNPDLTPEVAKTWTLGAVLSSPFKTPLLERLRLSVDWYSIDVTNVIGLQTGDIVQQLCVDPALNPGVAELDGSGSEAALAGVLANCQRMFTRDQNGALDNLILTYQNTGHFSTKGLDFQLDWSAPVGPGRFSLNSVLNYLISFKSTELEGVSPMREYVGTLGPSNNGLNGGAYRWKLMTNFGYSIGGLNLNLSWRHLPSVRVEGSVIDPNTTIAGAGAYDLFNLSGGLKVTDRASFRFGVDNLFNKAPPLIGVDTAGLTPEKPNTLPGGSFSVANAYFYDQNGRTFYIGASFKF